MRANSKMGLKTVILRLRRAYLFAKFQQIRLAAAKLGEWWLEKSSLENRRGGREPGETTCNNAWSKISWNPFNSTRCSSPLCALLRAVKVGVSVCTSSGALRAAFQAKSLGNLHFYQVLKAVFTKAKYHCRGTNQSAFWQEEKGSPQSYNVEVSGFASILSTLRPRW